MKIDIMTLFPDAIDAMMGQSIMGRAQERGYIRITAHQIRDYTTNKQMQVDDYPYGGGRGAVMQADPLYRCWDHICQEAGQRELSMGDFVLTGGEIPAMAVADCLCRMVPGVLPEESCYTDESHWNGLLEYPQYSRPEVWHGRAVPPVLLSGHHGNVDDWRKKESYKRTMVRRPDMFARFDETQLTTKHDRKVLQQAKDELRQEQEDQA